MLRTRTHTGNRIWTHAKRSMVSRSTTATTHPNTANHRGRMPRRTPIVVVEIVNAPAIRIANTLSTR